MFTIKNNKPNKSSKTKQGYYVLTNPEKYAGDKTQIIFRSGWEQRLMNYFDNHPKIVGWASEPIAISYINPLDKKSHRYFPDFWFRVLMDDQTTVEYLLEVKPEKDYKTPPSKKNSKGKNKKLSTYNKELSTYLINQAKFKAAIEFCSARALNFEVVDESWGGFGIR